MHRHVLDDGRVFYFLIDDLRQTPLGRYGAMVTTRSAVQAVDDFDSEAEALAWLDRQKAQMLVGHACGARCYRLVPAGP